MTTPRTKPTPIPLDRNIMCQINAIVMEHLTASDGCNNPWLKLNLR